MSQEISGGGLSEHELRERVAAHTAISSASQMPHGDVPGIGIDWVDYHNRPRVSEDIKPYWGIWTEIRRRWNMIAIWLGY